MLPPLYAIADTATLNRCGIAVREAIEAFLEGGARMIQLRHKEHFAREMFEVARDAAALCQAAGAGFVIDDRADVARILNAGVHLGQSDLPAGVVREIFPNCTIGFSTHNESQLRAAAAEPVDYVALGPIFATG